ncbi:LysR family transcriptional regulator [soil metagenome]
MKRLRILREVAKRGSFSAAAEDLYLSQSAVSQQIATLEREVGMSLLDRTRGGVTLTDAGRVLVSHADAAIARLDEAERDLAQIAGLEGGELRIASFPSASAGVLTPAIARFITLYPKVGLTVAEAEPEESLPKLRAGELDLAIVFDYPSLPPEDDRDLDFELLLTESMYLALPRTHEFANLDRVPLAELSDAAWLSGQGPSTCSDLLTDTCHESGFEPRVAFESDDYNVIQGFVAAGLGVTLLPDLALATLRDDIVVRPTEPEAPTRRVWAATRTAGSRSPATDALLTVLTEAGAQLTAEHATLGTAA